MTEPLNPIALQIGGLAIHWYGIIIASAVVIAFLLTIPEAKRQNFDHEKFIDLLIWAIPLAIISARIYYVAFEWSYYSQHPGDIIKIWEGGIAIYGALIGAVVTAIIFTRIKKISFWQIVDIAAPSLIIAQAIGRWGNFMNQEAYGEAVSRTYLEGLHLPMFIINQMNIEGVYHHPTFLYESLWSIVGFIVLLVIRRLLPLKSGEVFISYVIWYSFGRFFIEGMRTDSLMLDIFGADLRVSQVLALLLVLGGIGLWVYRRLTNKNLPYYKDAER